MPTAPLVHTLDLLRIFDSETDYPYSRLYKDGLPLNDPVEVNPTSEAACGKVNR